MKVLHVIPSISEQSGGPAQAIFPMCRALTARGHEVAIATTGHGLSELNGKGPQVYHGTSTHLFPVQWGNGFKYSRPLQTWLNQNVAKFDVVHIHAIFNHSSIVASRYCRKYRVPYVVRPLGSLDPWSMRQKSLRKSLFWTLAGKRMLESAAAIHYTAQAEFELVKDSLGLTRGCVVPLGIDGNSTSSNGSESMPDFELSTPASHSEDKTGLAPARTPAQFPYVLFLSRLHPKKGVDVLIKAFVALHESEDFSEWRLVIAGDGDPTYVDSLKELVRKNAADGIVRFNGWVSGHVKQQLLRNASLLVLPSRQENFGLCILEALAEGVPVIVSRDVNLASDIAEVGAGWIVNVEVADLQRTLSEALADKEGREVRGLAGRAFSRNFTWESIAEKLEHMYLSVIEQQRA